MGALDFVGNNSSSGGVTGAFIRLILRFFQFVLAITVAGLYGIDLHRAREMGAYTDGKWVYAEVVAGLSAVTVLIYGIPFFKSYWAFAWDWILTILWFALFGIFGKIFINANPTPKQGGIIRMKRAVWIDLVNALLWLITASYATAIFLRSRKSRTTHTGRATV